MVSLEVVAPLDCKTLKGKSLSLSGDHQFANAGLAVALCRSWLQSTGNWERLLQHSDAENALPEAFLRGLSTARLSGRAEIVYDSSLTTPNTNGAVSNSSGDLIFYLDGAHSPESLEACARWFSSAMKDVPNQFSSKLRSSNSRSNGYTRPVKNELEKISKQILLFNCMEVRDPEILLPTLVNTCASSGAYFSKAIFVPSISTYNKVTSGHSAIPPQSPSKDLSWQFNLQRVWERIIHGKDAHCKNFEMQIPEATPPHRFAHEDDSSCSPANGHFTCSAVVSSLPMTIDWLRNYSRENPSHRVQVLVTGSLHLVGDVLKLLRR